MRWFILFIAIVFIAGYDQSSCAESTIDSDPISIREEFDNIFGTLKIYRAIKDHLPAEYEELFQSYRQAKESADPSRFRVADFINSIRSAHLKQASSQSILSFYRHLTSTGRDLLRQDPDAAFSYLFGVDLKDYSAYLDYQSELDALGGIFEELLATSSPENLKNLDPEAAAIALDLVLLDLHWRYKEKFSLLERSDYSRMTTAERQHLCDIYLHMHEEIFRLEPRTRDYVLRSFAMRL